MSADRVQGRPVSRPRIPWWKRSSLYWVVLRIAYRLNPFAIRRNYLRLYVELQARGIIGWRGAFACKNDTPGGVAWCREPDCAFCMIALVPADELRAPVFPRGWWRARRVFRFLTPRTKDA